MNEIVFPAGILQPPAFDVNAVDAINYGAIGVVIGHEISHGFDDQGAKFDAQGRLNNWWTDDDLKRFHERTDCVVRQFEDYFIEPGIHHNRKLVLGESIGDLAGAKIAYRAFQKAQQTTPAPALDGCAGGWRARQQGAARADHKPEGRWRETARPAPRRHRADDRRDRRAAHREQGPVGPCNLTRSGGRSRSCHRRIRISSRRSRGCRCR